MDLKPTPKYWVLGFGIGTGEICSCSRLKYANRCDDLRDDLLKKISKNYSEAVNYQAEKFPGVYQGLANILVLPWSERFMNKHVEYIANLIHESLRRM